MKEFCIVTDNDECDNQRMNRPMILIAIASILAVGSAGSAVVVAIVLFIRSIKKVSKQKIAGKKNRKTRLLASLALIGICLFFIGRSVLSEYYGKKSLLWPKTEGEITYSDVRIRGRGKAGVKT